MGLVGWLLFGGWGFNKPTAPSAAICKFTKQSNSITGLMELHYFTGSGLVFLNVECVKIHLSISELVQMLLQENYRLSQQYKFQSQQIYCISG